MIKDLEWNDYNGWWLLYLSVEWNWSIKTWEDIWISTFCCPISCAICASWWEWSIWDTLGKSHYFKKFVSVKSVLSTWCRKIAYIISMFSPFWLCFRSINTTDVAWATTAALTLRLLCAATHTTHPAIFPYRNILITKGLQALHQSALSL